MIRVGIILLIHATMLLGKTVFFAVDISASMKRGFLFDQVKDSLIAYVDRVTRKGDRAILVGFGSDVRIYDEIRINSQVDKIRLMTKLHKLDAQDRFTWMTKAFALVGMKLRELNRTEPDSIKDIYIFTDGINEPPPEKEDSLTFEEIIRRYIGEFTKKNVFTYYISFGIQPTPEIKRFLEKMTIKPIIRPRQKIFIFHPSVKIEVSDTVFYQKTTGQANLLVTIKELVKSEGMRLNFKIVSIPESISIKFLEKPGVTIKNVGSVDTVSVIIEGAKGGPFVVDIGIEAEDRELIFEPKEISISFQPSPGKVPSFLFLFVIIIIIFLLLILLLLSRRQKQLLHR